MKLSNKFIIIVPTHNAKHLIESCLASLISQNFDDLGIIIRDDISTDGTDTIIKNFLGDNSDMSLSKINGKDVLFINNKIKLYPLGNTYESVMNHVDNPDAIIGVVDGDDSLTNRSAVKKVWDIYQTQDKWMVWSQHSSSDGSNGQSGPLPDDEIINTSRNYWSVSHFRTSKLMLFNHLRKEDLIDPFEMDSYFKFAGDAAFLFPFCEMCGNEKSHFIDEVLYRYNNDLPTNEHKKDLSQAIKYGTYIRNNMPKYKKLTTLNL